VVVPGDPSLAGVLVVGLVLFVTGIVGRFSAAGMAGFVGVILCATIALLVMLGRNIVIPLPDTALWHGMGIGFALGPGAGLPALVIGWLAAFVAQRMRGRAASTAPGTTA
jgi:hypothetical protein